MQTNMVQFTGPTASDGFPSFLSFDEGRDDAGPIEVTIHSRNGDHASITLPNDEFERLVQELVAEVERRRAWFETRPR